MCSQFTDPTRPATIRSSIFPFSVTCGQQVSAADWWSTCEADPGATFFATPEWSDILTSSFDHFCSKPFLFSFGHGIKRVIPAIEVKRWGGHLTAVHSMPFGTYGGIVGPPLHTVDEVDTILRFVTGGTRRRFQTTICPNPLSDSIPDMLVTGKGHVHAPDLAGGWEAWWQGLDAKTRYSVRKAERRGVEVRSDMDPVTYETFYNLHTRLARHWDKPNPFGERFFQSMWQMQSPRIQLWTAHKQGRMLAGVLVFRFQKQAVTFLSFVSPQARALAPKNLIYTRLIQRACEEGWTQLSFLGSGGKEGIERFKQSMGGRRREFRFVNVRTPLYRFAGHPIRRIRGLGCRFLQPVPPPGQELIFPR